jgi:protein-disulfide isomerase
MRRYLPFVIVAVVLLITAAGALFLYRAKSGPPLKFATGQPGAEPAHIRGGAKARVTLEEFGDFQCPPCGFLAATLLKVEHDYADSVRVVFRQFPLSMHQHAMTAACAAEAAGLQGKFWEMHDMLFQNSPSWGKPPAPRPSTSPSDGTVIPPPDTGAEVRATFEGYAAKIGLDVERFRKDVNSEVVKERIKLDQARASSIGVDRTPFLFLEGVQVPFAQMGEKELRSVIDAALSGRPLPTPPASPTPPHPQNPTSALPPNPAPPTSANPLPSPPK